MICMLPIATAVSNGMGFRQKVLQVVASIPKGSTLTYGEVAKRSGHPGASRAVGSVLKQNYDPAIPCHRVIRSDSQIGEYNRGREKKIKLLTKEGALWPNQVKKS